MDDIQCQIPTHLSNDGWKDAFYEHQKPVIVVLDPLRIFAHMRANADDYVLNAQRITAAMQFATNRWFELPDFRAELCDLQIKSGRHRTAAAASLGVTAYPVVTADKYADWLLSTFGASIAQARKRFDWTHITAYPTVEFQDAGRVQVHA